MAPNLVNIQWKYAGPPDFLLGSGATTAEKALAWTASLLGLGLYAWFYFTHALPWNGWQYLLAGLLAFDVTGGVVANALNSCKRFYHSGQQPGEPSYTAFFKNHIAFSTLHIHTILVALVFGGSLWAGVFWYIFLLGGTLAILKTPLYLRRPAAFLALLLACLTNYYLIAPLHGFEWLVPALMLKILYGHVVREEPYRPASE
jgi:hypothetical protein